MDVLQKANSHAEYGEENEQAKSPRIWQQNDQHVLEHAEQLGNAILHTKYSATLSLNDVKLH